jgi:hypothetical protein
MLLMLIVLAWVLAFICMIYLAGQAIGNVTRGGFRRRRQRKFASNHHFDEKRQRWVRNHDGTILVDEANEDRHLRNAVLALILLIMWEVYWILEIVERVRTAPTAWQLPYVFLFVVLIGIPLVVFLLFRRMRRSSRYASRVS